MEMARVMSKHQFDATLVFLAVSGEEQGLLGATHWAEKARQEGRKIEAMITNDIVGNTQGGNGIKDNRRVRVFSEGVPSNESDAQARTRRSVGGENDGPSRQLARYIKEAGELYVNDFEVTARLPPRPLRPRGRPHPIQRARLRRRPVHRAQREF